MRVKVGGGGRMVGVVEGEFDRVLPEDMVYFRTSDIIDNWHLLEKSRCFTNIMHHFFIRYAMTQHTEIDLMSEHLNNLRTELNSLTVNYISHPMISQPPTSILKIPLLKYQRANIYWMDNIERNPPTFIFTNRKHYFIGILPNKQNLYYLNYGMNFVTNNYFNFLSTR